MQVRDIFLIAGGFYPLNSVSSGAIVLNFGILQFSSFSLEGFSFHYHISEILAEVMIMKILSCVSCGSFAVPHLTLVCEICF